MRGFLSNFLHNIFLIFGFKSVPLFCRSTGARNDYILAIAAANAHQERYFRYDLQVKK